MPLGKEIAVHLPFLRRYARALSGAQQLGDAIVRHTLERIIADQASVPRDVDLRLALYAAFLRQWNSEAPREATADGVAAHRLSRLTPRTRQALLLTAMEGFTSEDAGFLMGCTRGEIEGLVAEAFAEIESQIHANVLIIEDEPMIAMDLEELVRELGHAVCAIAVTHREAVALARHHRPTLILADVQLADDSSGLEAAQEILADFRVPVIFITAFPERLLTGERPEPAFLVTKPFRRSTIRATVSQALFLNAATIPA